MVVGNLPFVILVLVDKRVTGHDLITCRSQGEFVDTSIHAPVVSLDDGRLGNDTLRLLFTKVGKVALDAFVVGSGLVADCGQQDGLGSISLGDRFGVERGQSIVPQVKKAADLVVGHGRGSAERAGVRVLGVQLNATRGEDAIVEGENVVASSVASHGTSQEGLGDL